jgi:hypothetical protein
MPLKMHKLSFNQSELPSSLQIANHPLLISMMRDSPNSGGRTPELISKFQQMNEEHASREYLQSFFTGMGHEFEELTSPDRPELIPDFQLKGVSLVPLTKSRTVEFQQTEKAIPIFGTRTVVELDKASNSLVSIEANFTDRPDVSPFPEISAKTALANIISYGKPANEAIGYSEPPELVFFPEVKKEKWHLAFHFKKVPVSRRTWTLQHHPLCILFVWVSHRGMKHRSTIIS